MDGVLKVEYTAVNDVPQGSHNLITQSQEVQNSQK